MAYSPEVPEEEIAEAESAPQPRSRMAVYLIIVGLALLFLPLFLIANTIKEEGTTLAAELANIQVTLAVTPLVDPTEHALSNELMSVRQQSASVESIQATLSVGHMDWPSLMAVISAYDDTVMSVLDVSQSELGIVITGQAVDQSVVMAYIDMLRGSGVFDPVALEELSLQSLPIPTATATPLPQPTVEGTAEGSLAPTEIPFTPTPVVIANFRISLRVKAEQDG
jgi:hypothetical protein